MPALLTPRAPFRVETDIDERAARTALRRQIARLEERLAGHVTSAFPLSPAPPRMQERGPSPHLAGARLQTLAELEERRDALEAAVSRVARELDAAGERQERARGTLERIMLDPAEHRWQRISHEDIGEPGCRHYHARPRLGLLGLLMNWWRVIVSSGCPLCMLSEGPSLKPCTALHSPV
jgi:hypothetical protein